MKPAGESNQSKSQKPIYRDTNLQIIFGITLISVLGVSSITPAFPKIVQELNISTQDVGLLISVFAVPGLLFALFIGLLADRFGRKKILVTLLMIFGIAGVACAFARDFNLLLILRFLQGIGMVSLFPLSITIIGDLYSGRERIAAMGYNAGIWSVGAAIFPVIGGLLAMGEWYYPFLLSSIAIPVGILVLFSLNNPEPKNEQRLKEYLNNAWQCIKRRQFVGLCIASAIAAIILFGPFFTYFPLLIGNSFGASPFIIGLVMASMSIVAAFTSSQIGKLAKVYSERNLLKAAFIFYALALIIIPLVSNIWMLLIPTIIFGIGGGIAWPSIHTLYAGSGTLKNRAALTSINGMVVKSGQTLGPLIFGMILGIWGISGTFYTGAGLSMAMFVLAVIMMR